MPAFHRFRLALVGFDPEALPAAVAQAPCVEGNMKAFFADATAAEVSRCVAAGGAVDARDGDGWTPLPLAAARSVTPSVV